MSNIKSVVPVNNDLSLEEKEIGKIKEKIYTIRGKQVMLDSDLAELYHCKNGTKTINQAGNADRFPERFMFQLNQKEYSNMWSQVGTTLEAKKQKYRRRENLPYVFTEQGVAMLATIIKTDVAIRISIRIMDAFIEMKRFLYTNRQMFERLTNVEYKLLEHDKKFEEVFNQFQIKNNVKQKIFFDGQIYDAFSMMIDLQKYNFCFQIIY